MAKTNTNRKPAAEKSPAPSRVDPSALPDQYALTVVGSCMAPAIPHGARATFSKTEKYGQGDIVVIWFRPEFVKDGDAPCALKRLTLALPPWVKGFPYTDHPQSDVAAAIAFEQDSPRRTYSMKCRDVAAIHKFTGCQ